ncbi:MAG: orotidine-5'-phosphate decarboxylase, partial [Oscillospiraceae bacterium]|nr:orotidine-5'-phosphate decarboxylase [Oscillospiraceae bacterium]
MDKLIDKIKEKNNPTVVGLDPKLSYIPDFIKQTSLAKFQNAFEAAANAIFSFNKSIIDAIYDIVPAIKPQSAYYEVYGHFGVWALQKTIAYAKSKGMYVITDGKRNDIGTTMKAYSTAYLGESKLFDDEKCAAFSSDALTVNGYLGTDGISPLVEDCINFDRSIFVLVKTSNPSSGELQDKTLSSGETIYEAMGNMCEKWGQDNIGKYGYSRVGAVVGATYPEQLKELRQKLSHTFFLVPGFGAQGATAQNIAGA